MPATFQFGGCLRYALRLSSLGICACAVSGSFMGSGCRVFRGNKISEENIAAARQLALQGIDAQQHNHWERAESLFAAAIVKCPSDERARYGYAEALWQRGMWQDAVGQMEESVRLSAGDPQRRVRLGQMYRSIGDLAQARSQADQAIAANPQLAAAWALRGQVLQAQGNRGAALADFHRALSFDAALAEVQLAVAEIYAQENRPQRALATLQALAAANTGGQLSAEITIQQARALAALDRREDATRLLAKAAQQADAPIGVFHELTAMQLAAGDILSARGTVEAGIIRYPQHAGFRTLAQELSRTGGGVAAASAAIEMRR